MVLAAFFFSLMAVTVKMLRGKIPSQEIVLARSIFMFIVGIYLLKRYRQPLLGRNKKLLFMRGFFGFLGLSAFFYTLTTIPIADSVVLQYTSPLFTAILAPFILQERNSPRQWLLYLLSFSGIVLIVKPGFSVNFVPALIGLAGAASSGAAYNLVRKLGRTEHPLHIILYLPALSIPLATPATLLNFVPPTCLDIALLVLIGLLTFTAQIFLTRSLKMEQAAKATNVSYISIVFSTVFGLLFWKEVPDLFTLFGALLVLISIYWMAKQGRGKDKVMK